MEINGSNSAENAAFKESALNTSWWLFMLKEKKATPDNNTASILYVWRF